MHQPKHYDHDGSICVAFSVQLRIQPCQVHQCNNHNTWIAHLLLQVQSRSNTMSSLHHFINDLMWHALTRASIPSVKEPTGRPDVLTLIPWHKGCIATLNITIANAGATIALPATASFTSCCALRWLLLKQLHYKKRASMLTLLTCICFFPLPFETLGAFNQASQDIISNLVHHISSITDDPHETSILYQCTLIAVLHFNAISLISSIWTTLT